MRRHRLATAFTIAATAVAPAVLAQATDAAPQARTAADVRVAVDPATGRIRPIEADEARELSRQTEQRARAQAQARTAPGATKVPLQEIRGPGNTITVILDETHHQQLRAQVRADGSLDTMCVDDGKTHDHGKKANGQAAKAAPRTTSTTISTVKAADVR